MADNDKEVTSDDLAFDPKDTLAQTPVQHNTNQQKPQTKPDGAEVLNPYAQKPNKRPEGKNT